MTRTNRLYFGYATTVRSRVTPDKDGDYSPTWTHWRASILYIVDLAAKMEMLRKMSVS